MNLKTLRISGAFALSAALLTGLTLAQTRPSNTESPYGGSTVEEIVARVNNQIITKSDYERAQRELDQEMKQRGSTMQEISDAHRDLLRNLIDQQLWLAKGKELGITGETELINRLNEIRKQYNLATMEDLEKAAKDQGVSFEDFKANIRNQIVTQQVMRDQVGRKITPTPGELQRFFEAHKQEYSQPESVKLGEILIPTGSDDPQKLAEAKAKAPLLVPESASRTKPTPGQKESRSVKPPSEFSKAAHFSKLPNLVSALSLSVTTRFVPSQSS